MPHLMSADEINKVPQNIPADAVFPIRVDHDRTAYIDAEDAGYDIGEIRIVIAAGRMHITAVGGFHAVIDGVGTDPAAYAEDISRIVNRWRLEFGYVAGPDKRPVRRPYGLRSFAIPDVLKLPAEYPTAADLEAARARVGLTKKEMAEIIGCSQSTYHVWMSQGIVPRHIWHVILDIDETLRELSPMDSPAAVFADLPDGPPSHAFIGRWLIANGMRICDFAEIGDMSQTWAMNLSSGYKPRRRAAVGRWLWAMIRRSERWLRPDPDEEHLPEIEDRLGLEDRSPEA